MLSTVVLVLDQPLGRRISPDVVARSLSWLVSAAVAGLVRDVVLACPPSIDLAGFADQAGCDFIQGATERDRLRDALARLRGDSILILAAGYGGDRSVVDELEVALSHPPGCGPLRILATSTNGARRLPFRRASTVGLVLPRASLTAASFESFATVAKRHGGAVALATMMRPLF